MYNSRVIGINTSDGDGEERKQHNPDFKYLAQSLAEFWQNFRQNSGGMGGWLGGMGSWLGWTCHFSDFWAKSRNKFFEQFDGILAEILAEFPANSGGKGGWLGFLS